MCTTSYYKSMQELLISKYHTHIKFIFKDIPSDMFYTYLNKKTINLPKTINEDANEWTLFGLLHEIGHIETNTRKMLRCEKEFHATLWAIKKSEEIGFEVPIKILAIYQDYIWKYLNKDKKPWRKRIPTQKDLELKKWIMEENLNERTS